MLNKNERKTLNKKIGWQLKTLRQSRGVSQEAVADWLGKSKASVQRYEEGATPMTADQVLRCAEKFAVPVSYLYDVQDRLPIELNDQNIFRVARVVADLPKDLRASAYQFILTVSQNCKIKEHDKAA